MLNHKVSVKEVTFLNVFVNWSAQLLNSNYILKYLIIAVLFSVGQLSVQLQSISKSISNMI